MLGSILAAVTQRPFFSAEAIRAFVRDSDDRRRKALFGVSHSNVTASPDKLRAIFFVISETQRNWLVADQLDAYIVTDDRKWEDPTAELPTTLKKMLPVEVDEKWSEPEGADLWRQDATVALFKGPVCE